MSFIFTDLLHNAEVVYRGEEGAPGVVCDGLLGKLGHGKTEFINFGRLRSGREWYLVCICNFRAFVASKADGRWESIVGVRVDVFFGWWLIFFDTEAGMGATKVEKTF